MLARVTTFEGGTADGIRAASEEMRTNLRSGPPPGVISNGFTMLADAEGGKVLMVGLFATEEDMRESEVALKAMTPPEGMGDLANIAYYELIGEVRMT